MDPSAYLIDVDSGNTSLAPIEPIVVDVHMKETEMRVDSTTGRAENQLEKKNGLPDAPYITPKCTLVLDTPVSVECDPAKDEEPVQLGVMPNPLATESHNATLQSNDIAQELIEAPDTSVFAPTPHHLSASGSFRATAASSVGTTEKKMKHEKKHHNNESFATEETLAQVQMFLIAKVSEHQCSSHTKEIIDLVTQHLSEKQRKRYMTLLMQRLVQHFNTEAQKKGEEVSIDIQSSICLLEQMFLSLGRTSPLQDMYTTEEEEMLELLFHSDSSNALDLSA